MHTIPKQESQMDIWYKKEGNCRFSVSETEEDRGVCVCGGGGGGGDCAKRDAKGTIGMLKAENGN